MFFVYPLYISIRISVALSLRVCLSLFTYTLIYMQKTSDFVLSTICLFQYCRYVCASLMCAHVNIYANSSVNVLHMHTYDENAFKLEQCFTCTYVMCYVYDCLPLFSTQATFFVSKPTLKVLEYDCR